MATKKVKGLDERVGEAVKRKLPDLLLDRIRFVAGPTVDRAIGKYLKDHRKEVEEMLNKEIKKRLPDMMRELVRGLRLID